MGTLFHIVKCKCHCSLHILKATRYFTLWEIISAVSNGCSNPWRFLCFSGYLTITLMTLNNANLLLFFPQKSALLYPWQDHLWDRNAIMSPYVGFLILTSLLWASYPTTFVWLKVSQSRSTAALSSPEVKTRKVQEAVKDQRKTWTQRTRTSLTKGPLITRRPFLSQVRRNNKSPLSADWIWSGKDECRLWNSLLRQNSLGGNILDIAYILLLTFQDTVPALCQLLPSLHWQAWWVISTRIFQMHGRGKK